MFLLGWIRMTVLFIVAIIFASVSTAFAATLEVTDSFPEQKLLWAKLDHHAPTLTFTKSDANSVLIRIEGNFEVGNPGDLTDDALSRFYTFVSGQLVETQVKASNSSLFWVDTDTNNPEMRGNILGLTFDNQPVAAVAVGSFYELVTLDGLTASLDHAKDGILIQGMPAGAQVKVEFSPYHRYDQGIALAGNRENGDLLGFEALVPENTPVTSKVSVDPSNGQGIVEIMAGDSPIDTREWTLTTDSTLVKDPGNHRILRSTQALKVSTTIWPAWQIEVAVDPQQRGAIVTTNMGQISTPSGLVNKTLFTWYLFHNGVEEQLTSPPRYNIPLAKCATSTDPNNPPQGPGFGLIQTNVGVGFLRCNVQDDRLRADIKLGDPSWQLKSGKGITLSWLETSPGSDAFVGIKFTVAPSSGITRKVKAVGMTVDDLPEPDPTPTPRPVQRVNSEGSTQLGIVVVLIASSTLFIPSRRKLRGTVPRLKIK